MTAPGAELGLLQRLTAKEAAALVRIRPDDLRQAAAAGELPAERRKGSLFFRAADVDAWAIARFRDQVDTPTAPKPKTADREPKRPRKPAIRGKLYA